MPPTEVFKVISISRLLGLLFIGQPWLQAGDLVIYPFAELSYSPALI